MKSVCCCIPNNGVIRVELAQLLYAWKEKYGRLFQVYSNQDRPLWYARNQCVKHFLNTGASWLFFVDSDVIPEPGAIERLTSHGIDKKIVHSLAHELKIDSDGIIKSVPMILRKVGPGEYRIMDPNGGLMEVDATGTLCVAIHRSVFPEIKAPWFDGRAEDFYFYEKARAAGFKVWVDCRTSCKHIVSVGI